MTYLSILIRNCVCIEIKQQVNYVVYNEINVDVFKRLIKKSHFCKVDWEDFQ